LQNIQDIFIVFTEENCSPMQKPLSKINTEV